MTNLKRFQAVKQTPDSSTVVLELNARVFTSTFKNKIGVQLADLYTYEGSSCRNPKEIVAHKTCAPILGVFVETIEVEF